MVVPESIHNIMGGLESTGGVTLHNHRRKLKQRFETIAKLGQGTYGKVQLGVNKETGQEVAIKTIKKCKIETEADLIRIRREIQIMSSLRHPYIIHIYEVFENKDKMVLVMEYAAGGELYDYLSKQKVLDENEARRIFRQIAMAVYYCHKHQICHRDLKLENILLDDQGNAKIADFGLSNVFDNSRLLSTFCGSPLYASPEIVKGIPYRGPEVDCWSLGVLLYTLVYGAMPFDGSNFKRLVRQISAGEYFEPKNPSSASELIKGLLTVKGEDRLDITGVCQHEWMAEEGKATCFRLAVELAEEVPNRLDLLLALAPQETPPAAVPEEVPVLPDKPARSQSLTSLSNVQPNFIPSTIELKKETEKENKEKERKRERSSSRSSKKDEKEEKPKKKTVKSKKKSDESVPREEIQQLLDAATNILNKKEPEKVEETKAEVENQKEEEKIETVLDKKVENQISEDKKVPEDEKTVEKASEDQVNEVPKEVSKESPPKRRKSRVLETAEIFKKSPSVEKKESLPQKKFSMSGVKVSDAKAAFERRSSLQQTPSPTPNFNLASTVNVNKLVMSELNKNKELEEKIKKENAVKVISHAISENELNTKKASTLPRRKLSKPSISRTEPEHMVANTTVSQTIYPTPPIPPPRPSLVKQDSGPKEHIIPIFVEKRDESEKPKGSAPISKQSSVSSRASTSSLGRQDSDVTVASAEPIRKSPREVIIPIAVEGGGYVTPSMSTLSKMSSLSENEEDPMRGFDLHSTRRKQHLETADSVSSDEDDDNFEMLTTENLYAKLLSRMRNLTQRLDEGRPMFPRLFQSSFDRLDFDPTPPWRRNVTTTGSSSTLPRGFTAKSLRRLLSDEKGENLPPTVLRRKLTRTTSDSVQNGHENAKEETSSLDRVKKYLEELNNEEISVGPSSSFASKYLKPRANYKPGTSQTSEFDKYINFKHSLEKERKTPRYDRVKELKEYRRSVSLLDEETPSKSILEKYLKNEKKNDSRVEKAIESLRRNSVGVENEFSESKLLKRAVSLEEVNPKVKNRNRRASSLKPEDTKTKKPPERKKLKKLELNKEFVSVSAESTPSADFDEARSFNSDTWSSSDLTERFYDVLSNMDDVSERIRRKSFYHRFNLPKRNVYHRSSSNMERKRYF